MSYDNNVEYCNLNTAIMLESMLLTNNFAIQVEELEYIEREIFDTSLTQERAIELINYLKQNEVTTDLDQQFDNINFK
tara:strand:+ start:607 stop:840 length:234 start_codon:yes stop_codon:yes gene_type:complete